MSTPTLSQRLRELQRFLDQCVGVTSIADARQAGHEILLDCIAQAEAQEAKPSQARELFRFQNHVNNLVGE